MIIYLLSSGLSKWLYRRARAQAHTQVVRKIELSAVYELIPLVKGLLRKFR